MRILVFIPLVVVALCSDAAAQHSDAIRILEYSIAALGGQEKLGSLPVVKIEFGGTADNKPLTIVSTTSRDRYEQEMRGAYESKLIVTPSRAFKLDDGDEEEYSPVYAEYLRCSMNRLNFLDYAKQHQQVTYEGVERIDGRDALKIECRFEGARMVQYFDAATYLLVKQIFYGEGIPEFKGTSTAIMTDYREVGGTFVAFKQVMVNKNWLGELKFALDVKRIWIDGRLSYGIPDADRAKQEVTLASLRPISLDEDVSFFINEQGCSADGTLIAGARKDNTIGLYDVVTGACIRTLSGYEGGVCLLAFTADGRTVLGATGDGKIRQWDITSGACIRTYPGQSCGNYRERLYRFSANGAYVLTHTNDREDEVHLCEVQSGKRMKSYGGNRGMVFDAGFSPDEKFVLVRSSGEPRLFDRVTGKPVTLLPGNISSLLFNPEGTMLLGNSGNDLVLLDCASGGTIRTFAGHTDRISGFSFRSDSKYLVSGGDDETIRIWDSGSGKEVITITDIGKNVRSVMYMPDGKRIVLMDEDRRVKIVDCSSLLPAPDVPALGYALGAKVEEFLQNLGGRTRASLLFTLRPQGEDESNEAYARRMTKAIGMMDGKIREMDRIKDLLNPKDEFETPAEHDDRAKKGKREQASIDGKYTLLVEELAAAVNEELVQRRNAEQEARQMKLRASLSPVSLRIMDVGTYDAAHETFPVKVYMVTAPLTVPRNEARSFKEQWQKAEVHGMVQLNEKMTSYDVFNLVITHPETGSAYTFGEQRNANAVAQTTAPSAAARNIVPPNLVLSARFIDPNGNGFLDARETGRIVVTAANRGRGAAYGVIIDLLPDAAYRNISYSGTRVAGTIKPGESTTIEFEITAAKEAKRDTLKFTIKGTEPNGFNPAPIRIGFQTYPLQLPEFILADYAITGARGDAVIRAGELAQIHARLQNKGQGAARDVKVNVLLPKNLFFAPESKQTFTIAAMGPGATEDITFTILTNREAGVSVTIPIEIRTDNAVTTLPLTAAVEIPERSMQEFVVQGKERLVEIKAGESLSVDIEKDIPVTKKTNPNAVAVVIGISEYASSDIPKVEYAKRDAKLMREYLVKVLGYSPKNILPQNPDELITVGTLKNLLRTKLASYVKPDGSSEIFVYYTGHGAPSTASQEPFFVPYDCDPNFVSDDNAYRMAEFYADIAKINAVKKTVVIDACFSGQTGNGKSVVKNASPVLLKVINPLFAEKNAVIFQSSESNQVSNWYPEKKHGMFTYFFLKGLKGEADANRDGTISVGELETYINEENNNLPYVSQREMQRRQHAVVSGRKETTVAVK